MELATPAQQQRGVGSRQMWRQSCIRFEVLRCLCSTRPLQACPSAAGECSLKQKELACRMPGYLYDEGLAA